MAPSRGDGDLLKNLLDHFADRKPLDFELRAQDEPMLEDRQRHAFDVVRSDKIAA